MKRPLVIYHDHCTDGFGAAFATWTKFGDTAEYLPMSYGQELKIDFQERDVYVLDFSFSKHVTDLIIHDASRFVWLDHHKTAFEMWCGEYEQGRSFYQTSDDLYICLDDHRSGALLAWEYFHPDIETPMLIKHIDDRDRWQFKIPGSKEFHAVLASMKPWTFEQWEELNNQMIVWDDIVRPHNIYREGESILRAHQQNVASVVKSTAKPCLVAAVDGTEIKRFIGLAANCNPHLASDVGHELANMSGTFGMCWYMGKDGKIKVSFRSNGDYDVSNIAKSFGGGGHKNAAGCEITAGQLAGWVL